MVLGRLQSIWVDTLLYHYITCQRLVYLPNHTSVRIPKPTSIHLQFEEGDWEVNWMTFSWCITLHLIDNYKKGCKNHPFSLRNSQELAQCWNRQVKYIIKNYNEEVAKITGRSPLVYDLLVSYKPEIWANAFFPQIR